MKKPNSNCAAVCGLFCGTCPSYLNDICGGCLSDNCTCDCHNGFKECAENHGVTRCFECANFPCALLEEFSKRHIVNGVCHHENVIPDLKAMKEQGLEAWTSAQTKQHTCATCGHLIPWHEKNAHRC